MTVPVQIRIDKEIIERIKRTARLLSVEENRDVNWRDLIRKVLEEKFKDKNKETL